MELIGLDYMENITTGQSLKALRNETGISFRELGRMTGMSAAYLVSIEKELFLKTEERKIVQEEKQNISKKIEEKRNLQQEIEKSNLMISTKKELISNNIKTIEQINFALSFSSSLKELAALIASSEKSTPVTSAPILAQESESCPKWH